jgi:hypothetical protein
MDLDVVNENNPDIERALNDPADVEQVIASAFQIWFGIFGTNNATQVYPMLADEATNTRVTANFQWSQEPRLALPNDPLDGPVWIPRLLWDNYAECVANTNDGLRRINAGLIIETLNPGAEEVTDNTDRAYTYAKLMQGICLGYYALSMDKFAVATEDSIIPEGFEDQLAWEREHWVDYTEAVPVVIRSLEQAIERASTGDPFLTPTTWQNQQEYNNAELIQVAHSMIARLLVYLPRTPEERAQVDWQQVLFHTERGLTTRDWGLTLQTGVITANNFLNSLQRTDNSSFRMLADPHLIGPADNSGNYQAWQAQPLEQRDRFTITTPDRRITGNTATSSGAYFRYSTSTNGLDPARGLYNYSFYQWYRRQNEINCTGGCGFFGTITAAENRLLRAEALLRTGNLQGAVDIINQTRTRGVKIGNTTIASNLPPVTVAGVPTVNGQCVPRKKTGECGDLMDALMWERAIELAGQDPLRAWWDRRGFGQLQVGTILHMPIPGRYIVSHGLPVYTYGGVGGDGAAR